MLGIFFLQENYTSQQYLFAVIIIIAGVFATLDEKFALRTFFEPSVGIGLLAMLFLALNNALTKWASIYNDVWTVNLWMAIVSLMVAFGTVSLFYKSLSTLRFKQLVPLGIMGVIQTVTNYALTSALATNVGITSIIMSLPLSMIMAFLFSVFAPKLLEKHTLKVYAVRFTAAIVMIYGALQLSR